MIPVSNSFTVIPASFAELARVLVTVGDDEPIANPEFLMDWTYFVDSKIQTEIDLKLKKIYEVLELDDSVKLGIFTSWFSPHTGIRGVSSVIPIDGDHIVQNFGLPGELVRGDAKFSTQIILLEDVHKTLRGDLSPHRAFSILWTKEWSIRLEGAGARTPVQLVDFSDFVSGRSFHAMWKIIVDVKELTAPADACLKILLNAQNVWVKNYLESPESQESLLFLHFLQLDLYRQLIRAAMFDCDEFSVADEYPAGSIGQQLLGPIAILGGNIAKLCEDFESDSASFETNFQSIFGSVIVND
ncbi:hypothetical protein [Aurantimicrobium sp. MWH-Uga1]|uniref:hypothetical protein n=1 Tax=Aurantimicrobium sp. MWH-Uga1 TaxID=2079575 RepID=UPI000DEDA698|nr:hypothetical protein [Aurantimicrobium sp. MWH-Uga1]AXE53945.1 hypothetical protein AURUGA1_00233 [Aurantimicrobium sp. MWH-Uga1]